MKEFPMFDNFIKHAMHELILFTVSQIKSPFNCVMLPNVIVQYKCNVTNNFKQDRASAALV